MIAFAILVAFIGFLAIALIVRARLVPPVEDVEIHAPAVARRQRLSPPPPPPPAAPEPPPIPRLVAVPSSEAMAGALPTAEQSARAARRRARRRVAQMVVAAEVFGPPLALRHDDTLAPPGAL